jgi:hypothetical protein
MRFYQSRNLFFWLLICAWLSLAAGQSFSGWPGQAAEPLLINEFVAANAAGLTDEDGDYSDWIELYNPGSAPINLSGWALTDDLNDPEKWPFPNLTLAGNAYLLIFASGKDRKSEPFLHTNFKLNQNGEFLGLYNSLNQRFAAGGPGPFPPQVQDLAYSRDPGGAGYSYLANPTPGQPNDETIRWREIVAPVSFSVNRGFYDSPFSLELTTATPDALIRYTFDGSEPTESHGFSYTGPLNISKTSLVRARAFKPNYLPGYLDTQTYIFLDDVLSQTAPPDYPTDWGIAQRDLWEYVKGQPVPADYDMDPKVINDPRYSQTIKQDLKSIPTLSLVTDLQNFDIYTRPRERGIAWERPVSVELIDPTTDEKEFQINAGLRIHGARGREEYILKHSFRLFFRGEYGAGRLNYPLFEDSPVQQFDTLILRGGVNKSYAGQLRSTKTGFELATYTEDEWLRRSQLEMSGFGPRGIFVHLYFNGLYWGLYNIVERPDADFMASYFGGAKEDWYVMNAAGPVAGPAGRFETLRQELYRINQLPDEDRYPAIRQWIDVTAFADYIILNWYAGTKDWPHNNWYAAMPLPQGQIRYFVWDGEVTWVDGAAISLGDGDNTVKEFFEALSQYPDFRMEFADRLYKHLFNDGALADANSQARWLRLNQIIDRAIVGESARWGDARYEQPITRDDWLKARDQVLAQMDGNGARLIALARQAGYYPPLDPPLFNRPGGGVAPGFQISLLPPEAGDPSHQEGAIYYTLDGVDPRSPGSGQIAASASHYTAPIVVTTTTQLKARSLTLTASGDPIWSALNEATFTVEAGNQRLRLTELMYNPPGGSAYEFLTLSNLGDAAADLSGSHFEGIDFTFPAYADLAPNGCLVLVRDMAAFAERYPGISAAGIYSGKLSNKGEQITLKDAAGQPVVSVTYDDENGWPLTPNGRGDSLVLVDAAGSLDDPKNWRASAQLYGTPCR